MYAAVVYKCIMNAIVIVQLNKSLIIIINLKIIQRYVYSVSILMPIESRTSKLCMGFVNREPN